MSHEPLTSEITGINPGQYRLSMQICDDALEVLLRPVGEGESLYRRIPYSSAAAGASARLEEAVYANPLLVSRFDRVDVLLRTPRYLLLPADGADAASAATALMGWTSPRAEDITVEADRYYSLVARVDRGVAGFVGRTFDTAFVSHPMAVLARWFTSRSAMGNTGKVFVNLRPDGSDIFVYNSLGLAGATMLRSVSVPDTIYYIMAMASAAGVRRDDCEVHLAGLPERRAGLSAALRAYAPVVVPAVFPAALASMGLAASAAPLELSVLPLVR